MCKADGCQRTAERGDFCLPHYHQNRRGGPLREPRSADGEADRVDVRMPAALRSAAKADAEREGVDEPEWWRRAGRERLARRASGDAPLVKVPGARLPGDAGPDEPTNPKAWPTLSGRGMSTNIPVPFDEPGHGPSVGREHGEPSAPKRNGRGRKGT